MMLDLHDSLHFPALLSSPPFLALVSIWPYYILTFWCFSGTGSEVRVSYLGSFTLLSNTTVSCSRVCSPLIWSCWLPHGRVV